MNARRSFLAFAIIAVITAMANTDDKPSDKTKRLTLAECEKLVEQLVNPEQPPIGDGKILDLPEGYSRHEKTFEKIAKAYNTLSKNCDVALPVLRNHVGDKRYSFIQENSSSGVFRKITVSGACYAIIDAHIQAHYRYTWCDDGEGRRRGYWFNWDDSGKDKSLAELQLAAMEWVMKKEKPEFFKSEEAWKKALKSVEEMADSIRKTMKPVAVEHRFYSRG